jgi:hypothetical protein
MDSRTASGRKSGGTRMLALESDSRRIYLLGAFIYGPGIDAFPLFAWIWGR